jgi:hypothetical protein
VRDEKGNVDGLPNVLLEAMAVGRPVDVDAHRRRSRRRRRRAERPSRPSRGRRCPRRCAGSTAGGSIVARSSRGGPLHTARRLSWASYGDQLVAAYERACREVRAT